MNNLFTLWTPDPVGEILGTGYYRYDTAIGISGLAQIRHPDNSKIELDILVVVAEQQGKGQLRNFIAEAKKRFDVISVWEDWNPVVGKALASYGFLAVEKCELGENLKGWRWPK